MILPVLMLALPLGVAFSFPLLGKLSVRLVKVLTVLVLTAGTGMAAWLLAGLGSQPLLVIMGGWAPPFGIHLHLDHLSLLFALVASFLSLGAALFQTARGQEKKPAFYMLWLLWYVGVLGILFTGDLFNLFVFIEIAGISSYSLIASGNGRMGVRGAVRVLVLGTVASVLFLVGVAFIYRSLGTLNIAAVAAGFHTLKPAVAAFAALSLLAPLLFEAEIFPFNAWVPDAYRGAPSAVGALLSGGMALAGVYALLRISGTMLAGGQGLVLSKALFVLGVITVLVGELSALAAKDAKKLLGFSSVGQMGLVVVAFSLGTDTAIYAGLFIAISHGLVKLLLFAVVGVLVSGTKTSRWKDWVGLGRRHPLLGVLFIVGSLGLIGVPLFSGFWGKFAVVGEAARAGDFYLLGLYVVLGATVVEAATFFRLAHRLFEPAQEGVEPVRLRGGLAFWSLALVSSCLIVLLGVWPSLLDKTLAKIPGQLGQAYVSSVAKVGR